MYDDEQQPGRQLLAPLAGEPAGPPRINIRQAMVAGRRQRRLRRIAGAGAAVAATALVAAAVPTVLAIADGDRRVGPAPAAPQSPALAQILAPPAPSADPPECAVTPLPIEESAIERVVTGGDPSGRYLLGSYFVPPAGPGTGTFQVLIWDDGEPIPVELPGEDPILIDINSQGTAVGGSSVAGGKAGWVYHDGQLTELAGEQVSAVSINAQGTIAGSRQLPDGLERPLVWQSRDAAPQELSVPGADWSVRAQMVDVDGAVVGTGQVGLPGEADPVSFRWLPDGTRQQLPSPVGDGGEPLPFAATSIAGPLVFGQTTQVTAEGDRQLRVLQYDLDGDEFTELTAGGGTTGLAWNASGWLAVGTPDGLGLWSAATGVAWLPGVDGIVPEPALPANVSHISADGRVAAGHLPSGEVNNGVDAGRPVVWHCS